MCDPLRFYMKLYVVVLKREMQAVGSSAFLFPRRIIIHLFVFEAHFRFFLLLHRCFTIDSQKSIKVLFSFFYIFVVLFCFPFIYLLCFFIVLANQRIHLFVVVNLLRSVVVVTNSLSVIPSDLSRFINHMFAFLPRIVWFHAIPRLIFNVFVFIFVFAQCQ